MRPLIAQNCRVIAHQYSDGNGVGSFVFHDGGQCRLDFEPLAGPAGTGGTEIPADLQDLVREVGIVADYTSDAD